jgi:hypothetical protein
VASVASLASAQTILQQWNFNDANGTGLSSATNSISGGATFATNITGVTTNGNGSLVIASNTTGAGARSFADIPDLTTGIYQIDVLIAGWNFTGSPTSGPLLEIGFSGSTANANSSRVAHLYFESTAMQTILAGVAAGTGSSSTPGAQDKFFGLVQTTPINFRLTVDFDARTYTIGTSADNYSVVSGGTIATTPASHIQIRALDNFAIGGTGFLAIDSITLAPIPEPSAAAGLAGLGALGLVLFRRRRRV